MNIIIYFAIIAGLYFTIRNIRKSKDDGNYILSKNFIINWKFLMQVGGMLFIAIFIFYSDSQIDLTLYLAVVIGAILGTVNGILSAAK